MCIRSALTCRRGKKVVLLEAKQPPVKTNCVGRRLMVSLEGPSRKKVNVLNLQGNYLCAKLTLFIKARVEIYHQVGGLCLGGRGGEGDKKEESWKVDTVLRDELNR